MLRNGLWDEHLDVLEFAYNNSYQSSIKNTPFYLNHGRHPALPTTMALGLEEGLATDASQLIQNMATARYAAKHYLEVAQARQAAYANIKRKALPLKVGDEVLLATNRLKMGGESFKKLQPRWLGPFVVTEIINSNAVKINSDKLGHKIHPVINVERLKPYHSGMDVKQLDDELSRQFSEATEPEEQEDKVDSKKGRPSRASKKQQPKSVVRPVPQDNDYDSMDDFVIELDDY
jgi:hypothetical protein